MEPLVIDWAKKKRKLLKSSDIFMFIANNSILSRLCDVSVNSKPPRRPQGIRTFPLPSGGVFAQLSLPGGSGF